MTILIDIAFRASVVVVLALIASALLRRRSAALRHWVLTAGMCVAVAVGPLALVMPEWRVHVPAPQGQTMVRPSAALDASRSRSAVSHQAPDAAAVPTPVESQSTTVAEAIALVWVSGVVLGAAWMLAGLARLAHVTSRAKPVADRSWSALLQELSSRFGVRRTVVLLESNAADVPGAWGVFRQCVLLPAQALQWDAGRARVVLAHELAHITRGDWSIQMMAEALRTLFWFNPLFWILCRCLSRESEQACDDFVLATGVSADEYAGHLVGIARACRVSSVPVASAMPIARASTLERRIKAMLNAGVVRKAPTRLAMAVALLCLLALALPVAAVRAVTQISPLPLTGTVYDPTGGVLPSVMITLADADGRALQTTTDASGKFRFPAIGPGSYRLDTDLPGFRPLQHEFTLSGPRDWERAITLQVESLEEVISVRAQRTTSTRAVAPVRAPAPVRVGGNIRTPRKLKDVRPVYPESMREAGLEGLVPIDAVIAEDGSVSSVRVLSAQVHPEFAMAAMDAVRQWRFSPTLLNGVAVDVAMVVSVRFSLGD